MPIDPRSSLGQSLEAANPAELDLRQLDRAAGEELARRMEGGKTREEAIVGILNHASRLMAQDVVSIDTAVIYSAHGEVLTAVEKVQSDAQDSGRTLSRANAITKLVIVGSRTILSPPEKEEKAATPNRGIDELFKGIGIDGLFGSR